MTDSDTQDVASGGPSSIWDVMEELGAATAAPSYLEEPATSVLEMMSLLPAPLPGPGFLRVASCGCRCRFCPRCAFVAAAAIKPRLFDVVKRWRCPYMIALTVDQKLFSGPEEAYEYLKDNRCVAKWVKRLRALSRDTVKDANGNRLVRLHGDQFFCVLETQKISKGGWPHFHVLMDASFVDFDVMAIEWGRFRPEETPQTPFGMRVEAATAAEKKRRRKLRRSVKLSEEEKLEIELRCFVREGERPEFGSLYFTKEASRIDGNAGRAVKYATKYLAKVPEGGWPKWVLERTRVRRYSTSHGFWGERGDECSGKRDWLGESDMEAAELVEGLCGGCGEFLFGGVCTCGFKEPEPEPDEEESTIGERMERCGKKSMLLHVSEEVDAISGVVRERVRYVCDVSKTLDEVTEALGVRREHKYRWDVPASMLDELNVVIARVESEEERARARAAYERERDWLRDVMATLVPQFYEPAFVYRWQFPRFGRVPASEQTQTPPDTNSYDFSALGY